jgi:hypothetical protein
MKRAIAVGFAGLSLFFAEFAPSPALAAQQFSCNGRMANGRTFSAQFLNGAFTQIRWEQSGQPPQVTPLTFSATNAKGQPIYRGSFQGATAVTLVDVSGGDVRPGSGVSVGVEEWGWAKGVCSASSSGGSGGGGNAGGGTTDWFAGLRQDLMGVSGARSRTWMQQNSFFFTQTMEHTDRRVVERWNRDSDSAIVDVVLTSDVVSDVMRVR